MVVIDVYVLYIDTLTKVLFNYECIILSADMKRKKKLDTDLNRELFDTSKYIRIYELHIIKNDEITHIFM